MGFFFAYGCLNLIVWWDDGCTWWDPNFMVEHWESWKYCIWEYLSFIPHKNLTPYRFVVDLSRKTCTRLIGPFKTTCSAKSTFKEKFMGCKLFKEFYLGRMRGMLVYDNSLSLEPWAFGDKNTILFVYYLFIYWHKLKEISNCYTIGE